jgi:hypothetical protein
MWVRITFWLVLLMWIADILQPGYLQFYGWRDFVALAQKLQPSSSVAVVSTATNGAKPTTTSNTEFVKNSSVTPNPNVCHKPKNDFESVLSSTNIACWQADLTTRRR